MRKVIHIDADCFFAAVEVRDNPRLAGLPIAVGGSPDGRGVVCTASYEARKFGVQSAMPSAQAKRLCPELIFVKPDMKRYKEASEAMRAVLARFTDCIEFLSLDEAYLDVTESDLCSGSATWMAEQIQQAIVRELRLSVSAGAAPVKFLAKIASDWRKPHGLYVIRPSDVEGFTAALAVRRLPGVGKVTADKLARFGLYDCGDLRRFGEHALIKQFGAFGKQLYERSWGRDERAVDSDRVRKSLSVERTFSGDLEVAALNGAVAELAEDLAARFTKVRDSYHPIKQFVKLKFSDFSQTTLEAALPVTAKWPPKSYFERMLHLAWHRHRQPVRLVGLGVRLKQTEPWGATGGAQLRLF